MLLLIVLLDAEHLAVAVLVLQDVSILLALEPRVLQVKQEWFIGAALEKAFHALTIFNTASIRKR